MSATVIEEVGVSQYEQQRLANIEANKKMLRALGLHVGNLTTAAAGKKAPLRQKARPLYVGERRQSARIAGKDAVDYNAHDISIDTSAPRSPRLPRQPPHKRPRMEPSSPAGLAANPRSCKNLDADPDGLSKSSLGAIIPPLGGQVKRAAMEAFSAEGPPTFSRMSGIQEWKNAVALFVNIYGESYKNVFLEKGQQITWFAQSQQWEGTPVVQRLIHSAGAIIEEEDGAAREIEPTPVALFCREEGKGYVYCGRLGYHAHDPDRLPIRFVWKLLQHDELSKSKDFRGLVQACSNIVGCG